MAGVRLADAPVIVHVARRVPRRAPDASTSGSLKTSVSPAPGRLVRGGLLMNLKVEPLLVSLKVTVFVSSPRAGTASRPAAVRETARTTARCGKERPS